VKTETAIKKGKIARALGEEFPGLALQYSVVESHPGRSPIGVKRHLRFLADRMHGRRALNLRQEPIASAYRVFFRQIGLDPDEFRTPLEAAVLERLRAGGFRSRGIVDDALTIATVETGVAMRAFDADQVSGELVLRLSQPQERLGSERDGFELPDGTLVVADAERSLGLIFGETATGRGVHPHTSRITLCAIQVQGVPDISVEEAIWICAGVLSSADREV
jgi:DNA/RNA-binding domain of Phe-tRNA-synthetase-like protein